MSVKPIKADGPRMGKGRRIGKHAWVFEAITAIKKGGISAVNVNALAASLKASRNSFYIHYKNRQDLLDALLCEWRSVSIKAYEHAISEIPADGLEELEALIDMWIHDKDIDPAFDLAVRDWARFSKKVAKTVREVDEMRISALRNMFLSLGYDDNVALVRARIAFTQQIGYYVLGIKETRKRRIQLAPIYIDILWGDTLRPDTVKKRRT
ncbi:MAG: TetR/AcrR family transcriptional regulator [Pseudomonadota bacterium]